MLRLNPFFIRSAVGILDLQHVRRHRRVLIPSSSGLRLEFSYLDAADTLDSLNPFFIRSAVGIELIDNSSEDALS